MSDVESLLILCLNKSKIQIVHVFTKIHKLKHALKRKKFSHSLDARQKLRMGQQTLFAPLTMEIFGLFWILFMIEKSDELYHA